jgi:TatD DNase family protein
MNGSEAAGAAPQLIDTHAHLDFGDFTDEVPAVLERARAAGVVHVVTVGTDLASSRSARELADTSPALSATAGVHPHEAAKVGEGDWAGVEALWDAGAAVAVGEIGLDYHYDFASPDQQREVFARQLRAAGARRMPVVVHLREAFDDGFGLMEQHGLAGGGVLHCFTGGPAEAERALEMGLHISFSGIVTFPAARPIREAAQLVPDNRLLVETDAPFLAPVPLRGRRNEPAYVVHTARRVAEVRGQDINQLARTTTTNAKRLFGLKL